jgi:hypothetical protein
MVSDDQAKIKALPSRKHTGGARKGNKHALTHGLTVLKHAVNGLGNRLVDKRTVTGKALAKWRADLIQDLGGDVSTQQFAIVDLAVKSKLLLDSIDAWLLVQPSLINARKRSLLPVVRERQTLADGLAKYMSMLGLERRHKVKTLQEMLSEPEPVNDNGKAEGMQ